jgi:hypothetical protein
MTMTSTAVCCACAASRRGSDGAAWRMVAGWASTDGSSSAPGFAWLHAFKRLRTRWEHRADIHLGLLQLACSLICHRQLKTPL